MWNKFELLLTLFIAL